MDKTHPLSSPMVVRSLNVKKDPFHHCKKGEELLVLKYHILVLLVHLCILLIVHDQILLFLLIY